MFLTCAQGAWLHDLDPVLLPISGSVAIRWYGLAYIGGFVIAWLLMKTLAKRQLLHIRPDRAADAILTAVIGVLLGGRLGYALFYQPALFVEFSSAFPFWGLLDLTRGGMASHGGMIGLLVASWRIAQREDTRTLHITDALALVAGPGVLLGRLANFVNGELLGRIVAQPGETAPWWSVRYPQELFDRPTTEQMAFLEGVARAQGLVADERVLDRVARELVVQVQAGTPDVVSAVEPVLHARHPSQLYQAFAEGLFVMIVLWAIWRTPRRPGVITGWFFIVYGVGRIATEFIRLPDAGLGRTLGLSRGQWLSVGMVLLGAVLLVCIAQRGRRGRWDDPVGGWASARSPKNNDAVEDGAAAT